MTKPDENNLHVDTLKHFKVQQKRYIREHCGVECQHYANAIFALEQLPLVCVERDSAQRDCAVAEKNHMDAVERLAEYNCDTKIGCPLIEKLKAEKKELKEQLDTALSDIRAVLRDEADCCQICFYFDRCVPDVEQHCREAKWRGMNGGVTE